MKLSKMAFAAAIAFGLHAGNALAQQTSLAITPVTHVAATCDCGQSVCGCEAAVGDCDAYGCDDGCDSALASCLAAGELGEPWSLFGTHDRWTAGGWVNLGYHTSALTNFNNRPNEVQLHQAWLYAQREIDTSSGFDLGGRIDYLYGTDGQDTQAFGTDPRGWDNRWDHGNDYGHAIPQLYLEAGYGDFSVIMGHFFTIIGWEVVSAPDNFFYSNAYTMYNSEPFTHTGTLVTYNANEDLTLYGGHVFGWDSGFTDNGDAFLGGASLQLTDDWNFTYTTVGGVFANGKYGARETGYMHSIVNQYTLTERLQYITQSDLLKSTGADGETHRDTFGYNSYLIYALNDRWALGSRFEWWSVSKDSVGLLGDTVAGTEGRADVYALTAGLNYRPHANVVIRPEVRYDWVRGASSAELDAIGAAPDTDRPLFQSGRDEFTFGIDTIFLF